MKKEWAKKTLEELCEFGNGLWTGKKPPFINVGVIRNTNFTKEGKLDDSDIAHLNVEQLQFSKRKLQYGDIILEKSGGGPKQPVGRVIIFDKKKGDFSFSNFTSSIRVKDKEELDFIYLHRYLFFSYISGATEQMQSHSTGIRNLKFDDYKQIEISYPSLPEQKRIVVILDEAFAAIDKAKANAEKNLQNSKELFDSYLQSMFSVKSAVWEQKCLDDICTKITDGVHKKPTYVSKGIPFIKINNLTEGSKISFDNVSYISKEDHVEFCKRTKPEKGDILITKDGTIGVVRVIETDIEFSIFVSVALIKPKSKEITPFLRYVLISPLIQNQIKPQGAALKHLYLTDLRKMIIPLPPSSDQQVIVQKLDTLLVETKKLETKYQQKLNDLEELKKSILQKAFAGELNYATEKITA